MRVRLFKIWKVVGKGGQRREWKELQEDMQGLHYLEEGMGAYENLWSTRNFPTKGCLLRNEKYGGRKANACWLFENLALGTRLWPHFFVSLLFYFCNFLLWLLSHLTNLLIDASFRFEVTYNMKVQGTFAFMSRHWWSAHKTDIND